MAKITENTTIFDAIQINPKAGEILMAHGMHCLGCALAHGETVGEAAEVHGADLEQMLEELNDIEEQFFSQGKKVEKERVNEFDQQNSVDTEHVKCDGCGANMEFDPEGQILVCPHCGGKVEFNTQTVAKEIDITQFLAYSIALVNPKAKGNTALGFMPARCSVRLTCGVPQKGQLLDDSPSFKTTDAPQFSHLNTLTSLSSHLLSCEKPWVISISLATV